MFSIEKIIENKDISDASILEKMHPELSKVSEAELLYWSSQENQATTNNAKRNVAFSKYELSRRQAAEQRKLTVISAFSGIVGTLLGVVVGYFLSGAT